MVGFPGETEEDFLDTLDVVKQVRFTGAFTFLYSRRQGTIADRMQNQVPEHVMKERFGRLLNVVNDISHEVMQEKLGKVLQVVPEDEGQDGILRGRADDNSLVHFKGSSALLGSVVNVKIFEARTFYLKGEIIE